MDTKNLKFQCAIYMGNYGINIYSNYPKIFEILSRGSFIPFIPEYRCIKKKAISDYSIFYHKNNDTFSAKMLNGNTSLKIEGPIKEIEKGNTIPFMAHFILEQQRQKNSEATMRGAGVSKNNEAILLIGKRGSGKTSISLELCRKYGYSLIGNDIVLIGLRKDGGYLFGGTKIFTIRLTTIKYYNTDLKRYFKGSYLREKGQDEWTTKIDILPKKLGIRTEKNPVKITKAFYVHLRNDFSKLFLRRIYKKETLYMGRLYLYEELTRYIRGTCIPILRGPDLKLGDYLPSLDKPEYHKWRLNLINWLIEDLGLYYISGPMDALCNYIINKK